MSYFLLIYNYGSEIDSLINLPLRAFTVTELNITSLRRILRRKSTTEAKVLSNFAAPWDSELPVWGRDGFGLLLFLIFFHSFLWCSLTGRSRVLGKECACVTHPFFFLHKLYLLLNCNSFVLIFPITIKTMHHIYGRDFWFKKLYVHH